MEDRNESLAGIQYHGIAGSSSDCRDAVVRLVQTHVGLAKARIITHGNRHALLLTTDIGDPIAIKAGFSSGYGGEGPNALSFVLQLLEIAQVEIDEIETDDEGVLDRVNSSALTMNDYDALSSAPQSWARGWSHYVLPHHFDEYVKGELWRRVPAVLPHAILDPRLAPLAARFWIDPDAVLNLAYRRLEDRIRGRTGLKGVGQKLFNTAFLGSAAKLTWHGIDEGEVQGRGQLFGAAFLAHRNPRAHQEAPRSDVLSEFLLLNHLFRLEAEAVDAPPAPSAQTEVSQAPKPEG